MINPPHSGQIYCKYNEVITFETATHTSIWHKHLRNDLNASSSLWVNIKNQTKNHTISKNIKTLIISRAEKKKRFRFLDFFSFSFSSLKHAVCRSASKTQFWTPWFKNKNRKNKHLQVAGGEMKKKAKY